MIILFYYNTYYILLSYQSDQAVASRGMTAIKMTLARRACVPAAHAYAVPTYLLPRRAEVLLFVHVLFFRSEVVEVERTTELD